MPAVGSGACGFVLRRRCEERFLNDGPGDEVIHLLDLISGQAVSQPFRDVCAVGGSRSQWTPPSCTRVARRTLLCSQHGRAPLLGTRRQLTLAVDRPAIEPRLLSPSFFLFLSGNSIEVGGDDRAQDILLLVSSIQAGLWISFFASAVLLLHAYSYSTHLEHKISK